MRRRKFNRWPAAVKPRTIKSLIECYEQGMAGAYDDPEADEQFHDCVGKHSRADVVCGDYNLLESGKGKLTLLTPAIEQLLPGSYPGPAQEVGDCFPAGTMVRMADGSEKAIELIEVGEEVLSHRGVRRKVIDTIKKPFDGDLAEIHVEGYARPVSATPDHRFVGAGMGVDSDSWVQAAAMDGWHALLPRTAVPEEKVVYDLGDFPCSITEEHEGRCEKPSPGFVRGKAGSREVRRHIPLDEKLAWLVGLYLAEGSCDHGKYGPRRITFNLGHTATIIAEQAMQYIEDVFGVEATRSQVPSKPTVIYVRLSNAPAAHLLHAMAGEGNTYTKTIPAEIFRCNRATRLALLRGWLDGDGHLDLKDRESGPYAKCRLTGVSVSRDLIQGMFDIANSCGLRATITRRKPRAQSLAASDLHFYGENALAVYPEKASECRVKVVRDDKRIGELGLAAKVKKVDRIPFSGTVYCIGVDVDHSFVANGYAVHNCVSHSGKNATLLTLCSAVLYGDELSGVPELTAEGVKNGAISTCWRYWFRGHGGHGWHCSSEITVAMREGTLLCKNYPEIDLDLTQYSGRLASRYGSHKPPEEYSAVGREHLVKTATQAKSFEEVRDLIANGYGFSSCGGEGFSSTRDANGVSQQRGSWAHAMAYAGVDDRPWAHETYGEPLVLVLNSWGARWISGPRSIHGTDLLIPHGSFWAKWSAIKRRSMFAISAVDGWPPQKLPDYGATLI